MQSIRTLNDMIVFLQQRGDKKRVAVVCANDATQDITGVGHVPILLDGSGKKQYIRDVWYVPDLKKNLISVSSIAHDQHMLVEFQGSQCRIKDPKKGYAIVATGTYEKGLYKLDAQPYNQHAMAVSCVSQGDLWHARFGHIHHRALTCCRSHRKQRRGHHCR